MEHIINEIIKVSEDMRHNICMEYTEEVEQGQKQLLALIEALKEVNE